MRATGAKLALTTALVIAGTAAQALAGTAADAATTGHVLVTCGGSSVVKPSGYVVTCRTSANLLFHMTWTKWAATAAGHGTAMINNCKPNCLHGHWGVYPVKVTLEQPKTRAHAKSYYSKLVLTFTGSAPSGVGKTKTETFTLPSHAVGG